MSAYSPCVEPSCDCASVDLNQGSDGHILLQALERLQMVQNKH